MFFPYRLQWSITGINLCWWNFHSLGTVPFNSFNANERLMLAQLPSFQDGFSKMLSIFIFKWEKKIHQLFICCWDGWDHFLSLIFYLINSVVDKCYFLRFDRICWKFYNMSYLIYNDILVYFVVHEMGDSLSDVQSFSHYLRREMHQYTWKYFLLFQ